jgi:AraC-like DNA-binding protein
VLSAPGDIHDFGPISGGTLAYVQVTFAFLDRDGVPLAMSFSELLGAWSGLELTDRGVVLQLDARRREEISACILRAYGAAESRVRTSHLDLRLEMSSLLAWLIREVYLAEDRFGAGAGGQAPSAGGLAAARAYLESRYRERISVADLAAKAFLSEGYFLRAFKRAYGVSPIACQSALRVQAARGLLRFTSLSCKEIAARLGYADGYHFSKSFRKLEGCSPTAYRRTAGRL